MPTGYTGSVEGFNARTMTLEVRGSDGRLYQADVGKARFEARIGGIDRAAEFVDLRPGSRVEVLGTSTDGRRTAATLVRITRPPLRAATADPFLGTAPVSAVAPAVAPPANVAGVRIESPSLRGTLRSIDRANRILHLRVGNRDIPVRYTITTEFGGIDARSVNAGFLRVGDRLRVEGAARGGEWTADRVILEPPMASQRG
ncbi:MAG TPA: DUF5666 domain-containing protein [Armatimonadota bacterium]|nr:DUF5666 domain-containing protein [Armatimonadota bacterium]